MRVNAARPDVDYHVPFGGSKQSGIGPKEQHGRFVEPAEIAAMIAYLVSYESGSCIGACTVVDGEMTAR